MNKQELMAFTEALGTLATLTQRFKEDLSAWSTANPLTATPCPVWCGSDHTKIPTHIGHIGLQQVGPDPLDVVVVRLVAGATIPACVLVVPLQDSPIYTLPLMLDGSSALSLSELLEAVGQAKLGDLVREAADILGDRPVRP